MGCWVMNSADGLTSKLEKSRLDGPADYDDLLLTMLFLPSGDCILIQVFFKSNYSDQSKFNFDENQTLIFGKLERNWKDKKYEFV